MDNKQLILVGGGGHCKSVIDVIESVGYHIKGIFDLPENVGKKILGYPIIGTDDAIPQYIDQVCFLVTVGQIKGAHRRIKIHQMIEEAGGKCAVVISKTAHVSSNAEIGEGSVIMHQAVVNAATKIGKGCIINTFANIEHDVRVNDYCHISTGAIVNGNCSVGMGTFVGSQSVVINGISITDECVVAAGAVVTKDIKAKGIYAGNPAVFRGRL